MKQSERIAAYRKTLPGLIVQMYDRQKQRAKIRPYNLLYTNTEFKEWCAKNPKLKTLFNEWVNCSYCKENKPSIDRVDCKKGYSMDNIQVLTWRQNHQKGCEEKKLSLGKKFRQYSMDDKPMKLYLSITDACVDLNLNRSNLWMALNGRRNHCGNFKWRYE